MGENTRDLAVRAELRTRDGAVTTAKIADGAVTTAKLAAGSVTAVKIAAPAYVRVLQTTVQSIPNGAWTTLTMADVQDPLGLFTTDTLTFGATGVWSVSVGIALNNSASVTCTARLLLNAAPIPGRISSTQAAGIEFGAGRLVYVSAATDTLKLQVFQNSTAAIDTRVVAGDVGCFLEAVRMGAI